jgi:hypothetical protein
MGTDELIETALINRHEGSRIMRRLEQKIFMRAIKKTKANMTLCGLGVAHAGLGTDVQVGSVNDSGEAEVSNGVGGNDELSDMLKFIGYDSKRIGDLTARMESKTYRERRKIIRNVRRRFKQKMAKGGHPLLGVSTGLRSSASYEEVVEVARVSPISGASSRRRV